MDTFNLIAGVVTFLSLGFAIYQYLEYKKKIEIELGKAKHIRATIVRLIENMKHNSAVADMIVQRSKLEDVTPRELGDLARIVRGNIVMIINELYNQNINLRNWTFGKFYQSEIESASTESPNPQVNNPKDPR